MAVVLAEQPVVLAPGVVSPDDRRKGMVPSTDARPGYIPASEADGTATTVSPADRMTTYRKYLRDYVDMKSDEIDERRESNRYFHCKQWTEKELSTLAERGQPAITYNRVARKINGVIGLLERLRQDPKAYPRTPAHIDGADVATQCLRYALDGSYWESELSEVMLDLCVAGIGGFLLELEPTDDESNDPVQVRVPAETFFYDPRSFKPDFADARYKGTAKWMAKDELVAWLPDKEAEIEGSLTSLSQDSSYADAMDPDREPLWWDGELKKARVIDVWFREGTMWKRAVYTGTDILYEGDSPFVDGRGKSTDPFSMQTCNIDEKGNRYGFVRNLKGPADEINHRRSKSLHAFNTKQVIVEEGIVNDVERLRGEAQRVDGVISMPQGMSGKLRINSNTDVALANVQLLQEAKEEIENFGPNTATAMGVGDTNKSGRAIALLQQAAISELGLFIVRVRAMKLRAYTLTWEAIRTNWTGARFVRITDDQGLAGFIGVNQPRMNEWGQVIGVENPIGKVMVDFVLDEGPDTVTLREDAQQALGQALTTAGAALPPNVVAAIGKALIQTANLPPAAQKEILAAFDQASQPQQPPPGAMEAMQIELAQGVADVEETKANTIYKLAQAGQAQQPDMQAAPDQGMTAPEIMETLARVDETRASAILKLTQADKTRVDTALAPQQAAQRNQQQAARPSF